MNASPVPRELVGGETSLATFETVDLHCSASHIINLYVATLISFEYMSHSVHAGLVHMMVMLAS